MLTRRTNVLLNETDYETLLALSKREGKTMGELIRHAVRKTYKTHRREKTNAQILAEIDKLAKKVNTKGINYKELVEYGRKY